MAGRRTGSHRHVPEEGAVESDSVDRAPSTVRILGDMAEWDTRWPHLKELSEASVKARITGETISDAMKRMAADTETYSDALRRINRKLTLTTEEVTEALRAMLRDFDGSSRLVEKGTKMFWSAMGDLEVTVVAISEVSEYIWVKDTNRPEMLYKVVDDELGT